MGTSPTAQALALLPALFLGTGLGLLYDLLRPPRRRGGAALQGLLDLLFALSAGAAAFLNAMAASNGRLGIWELAAALAGFLFYLHLLSPAILPLLERLDRVMSGTIRSSKKTVKKLAFSAKKFFSNGGE